MKERRGESQRAAIRAMVGVFSDQSDNFVVVGSCALGLYARADGPTISATKDVDCISLLKLMDQQSLLAKLSQSGALAPDPTVHCRYLINGTNVSVDVIDLEGATIGGGINRWMARAAETATSYDPGGSKTTRAVTPPYFLATKLVAAQGLERNDLGVLASKDIEDIVTLAAEVEDLVQQVRNANMGDVIAVELSAALTAYGAKVSDIREIAVAHSADDPTDSRRVEATLKALLRA